MSGAASIAHDNVIRSTEDLAEEKMEEETKDNPVQRGIRHKKVKGNRNRQTECLCSKIVKADRLDSHAEYAQLATTI